MGFAALEPVRGKAFPLTATCGLGKPRQGKSWPAARLTSSYLSSEDFWQETVNVLKIFSSFPPSFPSRPFSWSLHFHLGSLQKMNKIKYIRKLLIWHNFKK